QGDDRKKRQGRPFRGCDAKNARRPPLMRDIVVQNWQLFGGCAFAAVVLFVAFLSLRSSPYPYERRGVILGPAEINFFRTLQNAVREDWVVFSMVRLADVIKVRPKTRQFQSWHSRIFGKHLDFVICDGETMEGK